MSRRIRRHLRSNVVGYIALFCFAIGGTAYATHPGGANTISTEDIINGQVLTQDIGTANVLNSDIAPNSVTSTKLVDSTVQSPDVAANTLTGSDIDEGTLNGSRVVARASGSSSVAVPSSGSANYPLANNAWTQRADESDRELFGTITYDQVGAPCSQTILGITTPVPTQVSFSIDGANAGGASHQGFAAGTTTRTFSSDTDEFFEPGAADPRTLTASLSILGAGCDPGTNPPTVTGMKVNVLGVS